MLAFYPACLYAGYTYLLSCVIVLPVSRSRRISLRAGFSLIELLVVISIIGIISTMGVVNYSLWRNTQAASNEALRLRTFIEQVRGMAYGGAVVPGSSWTLPPVGGYGVFFTSTDAAIPNAAGFTGLPGRAYLTNQYANAFLNGDPNLRCPNPPRPSFYLAPDPDFDPDLVLSDRAPAGNTALCPTDAENTTPIDILLDNQRFAFAQGFRIKNICIDSDDDGQITNYDTCADGTQIDRLTVLFVPLDNQMIVSENDGVAINLPVHVYFGRDDDALPAVNRVVIIDARTRTIREVQPQA